MKIKSLLLILTIISITRCNYSASEHVIIGIDKDLIPEGIAVDARSGRFFLNSLKKHKIIIANLDGSSAYNFIESGQYNYLAGFGMTIKGDTLYALNNGLRKENNASALLLFNTRSGQLIDQYRIAIPPLTYLNDLAISSHNEIYITDSKSNKVYKIKRPEKYMEVFLDTMGVPGPNGIAISDDNTKLYLASEKGIRTIDILTKQILNKPDMESSWIDGMKFYKNSLIGIQEKGIFQFVLDKKGKEVIIKKPIILFDSTFKSPLTFDIVGSSIYFIKNSQLENFNDQTDEIINKQKLESLILYKKKLTE